MLILHGFPYSNYHNIVKHALMIKGIPFEEHIVYPNSPAMMAINPTGKVPAMTTEQGTQLSESSVLVDYLEDAYPQVPLYPADADARARVRQIMKVSELYLDLPARRLLPAELFGAKLDDTLKDQVRAALNRGARSLSALASFSPYLLGEELTLGDIYLRYALSIPKMVGPAHLNWNVKEEVPGLAEWGVLMADSDISRKIDADTHENAADFMAHISKKSN
jgi:glutathione S-transferase